jgi:hypothetical protein
MINKNKIFLIIKCRFLKNNYNKFIKEIMKAFQINKIGILWKDHMNIFKNIKNILLN